MHRSTFNIYEEYRLIQKEIKDSVLSEFLYPRQTPFLNKYPELIEEAREAYISSAGFKSEWAWEQVIKNIEAHYNGDEKTRFAFYDYLLSLKHGLKSKKQIEKQRREKDSLTFSQEVENLFFSESENAFFTYNLLNKSRKIKRCWYPGKKEYDIKKLPGEIRLVSMDVASSGKKDSDNSVITLFRLIPTNMGYVREISYIMYFNGINTLIQTKILKSIYYSWKAEFVILDVLGVGSGVYDACTTITEDEEYKDGEYPAWTVMKHDSISQKTMEDLTNRTKNLNCLPCIYPIIANVDLNHKIAVQLLNDFEKGLVRLLVDERKAEDIIEKSIVKKGKQAEFILSDVSKKMDLLYPYCQTTGLINEMIGLETVLTSGKIKLVEASHKRKDRYTSLAYGNYFASLLDLKLLKQQNKSSNWLECVAIGNGKFEDNSY